jgi:beta-hydroxyacyl-ACP dehydratase FabZ
MGDLEIRQIMERLPHRFPMLLLDRVLELEPDKRIVALKNVTINEPFFQGHFPDLPVMPGVLILEAMAQAGGMMVVPADGSASDKSFFLASIGHAKFRRTVIPGDQLTIEITVAQARGNFRKLSGKATVEGRVVAEAELTLVGVDAP